MYNVRSEIGVKSRLANLMTKSVAQSWKVTDKMFQGIMASDWYVLLGLVTGISHPVEKYNHHL